MSSRSRLRPVPLAIVIVLGIAIASAWNARTYIAWHLSSTGLGPIVVGPATVTAPESLPARHVFARDGDVKLLVGELGYDPMALRLELTPLGQAAQDEAAERAREDLENALSLDNPGAKITRKTFGAHPGFVMESTREGARTHLAVVVAQGVLVRFEVSVLARAPAKWRVAADEALASLSLEDAIDPDALATAFSSRAWDACGSGDVEACLWTARSSWRRGRIDGARAALERGFEHVGPIEALWEETKASAPAALLSAGAGTSSAAHVMAPASRAAQRLEQAVALSRLQGDLELAQDNSAAALAAWERTWRFDADGKTAERMLTQAAALLDESKGAARRDAGKDDAEGSVSEGETSRFLALARAVDERFGQEPKVALAAALLASRAGDFSLAKAIAQRVYEGHDDAALRREVVRVPLSPPPALEPLACAKGLQLRRETTAMGTIAEACVDRAGKRQGPGRAWFASTGYLLEEVTYTDDEPGAPDQRYWENGQLQRRSLVDARGAVTVERFDPFGRPLPDGED